MLSRDPADPGGVQETISILVASRSPAYATGLAAFLDDAPLAPVAVHTIQAALERASATVPALVIVDGQVADGPGEELVSELLRRHPGVRVLWAAPDDTPQAHAIAHRAGACGVVSAMWPRELVAEAAADALRGACLDAGAERSLRGFRGRTASGDARLTEQERVVLRLMRQHLTYKEIAVRLGVSWHTVRTHAQSILRKSGVHSRRELECWGGREAA